MEPKFQKFLKNFKFKNAVQCSNPILDESNCSIPSKQNNLTCNKIMDKPFFLRYSSMTYLRYYLSL